MGTIIEILGESGMGKSSGLRNFEEGELGIFNVTGKPLPFRRKLPMVRNADYATIERTLEANNLKCYVVDDAGYLMQFDNFRRAGQKGYDKFVDMAVSFEQILEAAIATDDDTTVYFLMHPDYDANGRMKTKSIGKMLDEKLCIEGLFPIVLVARHDEDGYWFETQTDGSSPAKSPMGMFEGKRIDNDIRAVDDAVREYWGLAPRAAKASTRRRAAKGGGDA